MPPSGCPRASVPKLYPSVPCSGPLRLRAARRFLRFSDAGSCRSSRFHTVLLQVRRIREPHRIPFHLHQTVLFTTRSTRRNSRSLVEFRIRWRVRPRPARLQNSASRSEKNRTHCTGNVLPAKECTGPGRTFPDRQPSRIWCEHRATSVQMNRGRRNGESLQAPRRPRAEFAFITGRPQHRGERC